MPETSSLTAGRGETNNLAIHPNCDKGVAQKVSNRVRYRNPPLLRASISPPVADFSELAYPTSLAAPLRESEIGYQNTTYAKSPKSPAALLKLSRSCVIFASHRPACRPAPRHLARRSGLGRYKCPPLAMADRDEANLPPPPSPLASSPPPSPIVFRSTDLFRGRREIFIAHAEDTYCLRIISNDKLLLTK
jgi:hemin uptake protein HemP